MLYAKAVVIGLAASLAVCAIWVTTIFVVPLMLPMIVERVSNPASGGVGVSVAYISTGPLALIAVVAFVAGFVWRLRTGRRAG